MKPKKRATSKPRIVKVPLSLIGDPLVRDKRMAELATKLDKQQKAKKAKPRRRQRSSITGEFGSGEKAAEKLARRIYEVVEKALFHDGAKESATVERIKAELLSAVVVEETAVDRILRERPIRMDERKIIAQGLRSFARRVARRFKNEEGRIEARLLRSMAGWIADGSFPLHSRDRRIPVRAIIRDPAPPRAVALVRRKVGRGGK